MTTPPEDDDARLAAEYVLGTLDRDERVAATARRERDTAFDALVADWETRLVPLSEATREVEAPAGLWQAILRRLDGRGAAVNGPSLLPSSVVMLARSVRRWQWATAGATALAACLATLFVAGAYRQSAPAAPTLVAFLQRTNDEPAYLVKANLGDRTLSVKTVAAKAPPGRSYELWIIDPSLGPPKSLGILDDSISTRILPATIPPQVLTRATYAVTDEQAGGSPDGKPSGAPIFLGHLVSSTF